MSGLTRENLVENGEILNSGIKADNPSREWTNEKHRLYLRSMEETFVRQLYNARGRNKVDLNTSSQSNESTCTSSGQFKILQGGTWKKLNLERAQPRFGIADEKHSHPENMWIQHFTSGGKHQEVISPSLKQNFAPCGRAVDWRGQKKSMTISKRSSLIQIFHRDPVESVIEVSDQNFENGDYERKQLSSFHRTKRMKTESTEDSMKDQVVPMGKYFRTPDLNEKYSSPEIECEVISDW